MEPMDMFPYHSHLTILQATVPAWFRERDPVEMHEEQC